MLPKTQRLTKAAFDVAFKEGVRHHSPHFQLIHLPGGEFHSAVVVGKKVFKSAVARNRLRRRVYGVVYRDSKQHNLAGTWVVIAKPSAKDLSQKEVAPAVREVLALAVS